MAGNNDNIFSPIHSVEVEQAVLGCCLIEPELAETLFATCDKSWFYTTLSKEMFQKIKEVHESGIVLDITILANRFKDPDERMFLINCYDVVISASNFNYYLKELQSYKIKRELQLLGLELQNINGVDVQELLTMAQKKIQELQPVERVDKKKRFDEIIDEFVDLKERGCEMKSSFPTLDDITAGFRRKRIYLLGGFPGTGKTGLALFLAYRIAFEDKKKVLFFSLEMSDTEIVGRLTSINAGVPAMRMQKPWLMTKEDTFFLTNTVSKLYKSNLEIEDGAWTLGEMVAKIKEVKPDIVFIDHLQHLPLLVKSGEERTHETLALYVRTLKDLAKKENLCVFILSQRKRGETSNIYSDPASSDFKGATSIKEQADLAMMIQQYDHKKDKDKIIKKPEGYFTLHIVKNRHGKTGMSIQMLLNLTTLHYNEYTEKDYGGDGK